MTVCMFWCTTLLAFCVVTLQFDFLGAFAKLQQVTVSFIISICPSVQSICMEQLDSYWTDFREIWYFRIEFVIHIRQEKRVLHMKTYVQGCWWVLSLTRKETSYSDRRFWVSYFLFIIIIGGILVLFMYITRLASNEIF